MTRTIEQILGLTPMNQNDLVASPMRTLFIDNAARGQLQALVACAEPDPAESGRHRALRRSRTTSPAVKALRVGWMKKKAQIFAGKHTKPDSEDPDTVNHSPGTRPPDLPGPIPARRRFAPPANSNRRAPKADLDD